MRKNFQERGTEKGSIEKFNPRSVAQNVQSRRPRSNFSIPRPSGIKKFGGTPPLLDCNLAHRNRSDFCDFRLRCPSQTPDLSRVLGRGCDEALFSEKKGFSVKRGRQFSEWGLGKDFYRKSNSVKRFGRFSELPDSEN